MDQSWQPGLENRYSDCLETLLYRIRSCGPDLMHYDLPHQRTWKTFGQARAQYELVHKHGIYDLEVDTSQMDPKECAEKIKEHILVQREPKALRLLKEQE